MKNNLNEPVKAIQVWESMLAENLGKEDDPTRGFFEEKRFRLGVQQQLKKMYEFQIEARAETQVE